MSTPNVPTNFTLAIGPGVGQISLAWTIVQNAATITSYTTKIMNGSAVINEITILGDTPTKSVLGTSDGLVVSGTYDFFVRANAGSYSSEYAGPLVGVAPDTNQFPNAPTLTATAGTEAGQINLTWTTPSNSASVGISNYTVEYTNLSTTIVSLRTTTNTITNLGLGLTAGTSYSFRVRANAGTLNGFFSDAVVFTPSGTISVPCYAKGTLILTDKGYIKIEDIKKGDKVVREGSISKKGVLEKNKIKEVPVTWVSKFKIETLDSLSRPICIAKNAFGEDRPFENLYVSPGHSIMIDDRLITAKNLRNGDTIYPYNECESVEYYHVQCETHSAIYANGVLSETYIEWRKEFFNVINYLE